MNAPSWLFWMLGLFGAVLTSMSWIPQVYKSWQTKRLEDLSWVTLIILEVGTFCWLAYGIFRADALIIGANGFIGCCIASLMLMKWRFKS